MDYVQEYDEVKKKNVVKKIGLNPIQREGMEYEFTVFIDIDQDHNATTSKDRTSLLDGTMFKPSFDTGKKLLKWLESGVDAPVEPVNWPAFWVGVKNKLDYDEDDVHGIASAMRGTKITSIADWTREQVAELMEKLKETYKEDREKLKQMEVEAEAATVDPLIKELTELWQQTKLDEKGTIEQYLKNRFKKTVAEITDDELKSVIDETKKYLANMKGSGEG